VIGLLDNSSNTAEAQPQFHLTTSLARLSSDNVPFVTTCGFTDTTV
jgi:hypothetical protein